jgi:hypothetical protein
MIFGYIQYRYQCKIKAPILIAIINPRLILLATHDSIYKMGSDYWVEEITKLYMSEGLSSSLATGMARVILDSMNEGGNWQDQFSSASDVYSKLLDLTDLYEILEDYGYFGREHVNQQFEGSVNIGAAYKGFKHFKEVDTVNFYCPENSYCLFRCIEKYYTLPFGTISRKGISPYNCSKQKLTSRIREAFTVMNEVHNQTLVMPL